jgi:hypothetical protein
MSFDNKHYPNRKDNRRVYKYEYSKSVDRTCRNHGSCGHCENNRTINARKTKLIAKNELANLGKEGDLYLEGIGTT